MAVTVRFTKMHGAGNDFVMIDDREERIPTDDPAFIARLANRPDGIGCEGVILVRPANGEATSRSLKPETSHRYHPPSHPPPPQIAGNHRTRISKLRSQSGSPTLASSIFSM